MSQIFYACESHVGAVATLVLTDRLLWKDGVVVMPAGEGKLCRVCSGDAEYLVDGPKNVVDATWVDG